MIRAALLAVLLAAPAAAAEPRPVPRSDAAVVVLSSRGAIAVAPEIQAPARSAQPIRRPSPAAAEARAVALALRDPLPRIDAGGLVRKTGRPLLRDTEVVRAMSANPRASRGGGLCGRGSLRGERIEPVPGPGACGIPEAVRVRQVAGLTLSTPARMDCRTAQALDDWVRKAVIPEVGATGGGATRLRVAAGYACRSRNSQRGAKVSEHAKGRAIDIAAIGLADGSELSVLRDWGGGERGRILRALHRAACGPFGTVVGPESDRFHQDHIHLDTARYRSGSYCR
ncbi:extensin-like domain-containing protein [Jannaschia ovalis]|uniref:Extensin family protein n=1 Tax=Jannaschia ovalis TaxID=3038773 RepID=A0ABY8LFB1_9RHOB|nr:extensin family protein [Jannaschia sp. GRR-S6-38]WGH79956.1 extensin family protein [Jannaschia sp. GRR-S6-38]